MQQGRKTGVSEFLQGQTGNHRFLIPVKKCLDSCDCFYFKLVGGVWLAKARFLCCYILSQNFWLIKQTHMRIYTIYKYMFCMYSFLQMAFWRNCEWKFFKFNKNLLNSWKRVTEKNYSTCRVQQVQNTQLSWGCWQKLKGIVNSFIFAFFLGGAK